MWSSIQVGVILLSFVAADCPPSVTTVSGQFAPRKFCSGKLIFAEEFNRLNVEQWQHELTLAGGGVNSEFQYYDNNRTSSFAKDGVLFIKPTLTSDHYGEHYLVSGTINLEGGSPAERCTNPQYDGCERTGTYYRVLNPVRSARIRTVDSFNFRYGYIEVRAKMPAGDWLWPAIRLLPVYNYYGNWPSSGEIDIVQSRGNRDLKINNTNIGTQQVSMGVTFGPYSDSYELNQTNWFKNNETGFNKDFHLYQLEWTPDFIKASVDGEELGKIEPGENGFWKHEKNDSNPNANPWRKGDKIAPFDQEFYIAINVAVGGVSGYFPDNAESPKNKTWTNDSPTPATDFWEGRESWLSSWELDKNKGINTALQVDYVRVWAL